MKRTVIGGGYGGSTVAKALDALADVDPSPDGPVAVPAATISAYKGADLAIGRYVEMFGTAGKEKVDA